MSSFNGKRGATKRGANDMTQWVTASLAIFALAAGVSTADERQPRVVFNDDAQMLFEAPREGTSKFVKAWLDKELEAVPFSTYVFLATTPDICTFDSKAGETYGDRFGSDYSYGWTVGTRGLRAEGTVWACVFNEAQLEQLVTCNPAVAVRMLRTMANRIAEGPPRDGLS